MCICLLESSCTFNLLLSFFPCIHLIQVSFTTINFYLKNFMKTHIGDLARSGHFESHSKVGNQKKFKKKSTKDKRNKTGKILDLWFGHINFSLRRPFTTHGATCSNVSKFFFVDFSRHWRFIEILWVFPVLFVFKFASVSVYVGDLYE